MKKICSLLLVLIITTTLLSGCVLPFDNGGITKEEIEAKFYEAYDLWNCWVYGSAYRQYNEIMYVDGIAKDAVGGEDCPINTKDELTNAIQSHFTKELSDKFLSYLCPEDIDGRLYIFTTDVGDNGEEIEGVTIEKINKTMYLVKVDVYHVYDETHYTRQVLCVLEEGNWVFENSNDDEVFYCEELPQLLTEEYRIYAQVLSDYIEAIYFGEMKNNFLDEIIRYSDDPYGQIGYCFMDVNKDGTDELLLGEVGDNTIYAIYSQVDGYAYETAIGWSRNRYYVYETDEGYMIANEGSSGAGNSQYIYYTLSQYGDLRFSDGVIMNVDKSFENPWFKAYEEDYQLYEDSQISEELYYEIIDAHKEMYIFPDFRPLAEIS